MTEKQTHGEVLLFFSTDPLKMRHRVKKFCDAFLRYRADADVAILTFSAKSQKTIVRHAFGDITIPQYIYGDEAIASLKYPAKGNRVPFRLIPGNCDLPVLLFWLENNAYTRYWVMEDDVEYTGDPANLFRSVGAITGDLLATHINKCFEGWDYTAMFRSGSRTRAHIETWLCFLPFFAATTEALNAIHRAYLDGWDGHHEMSWPTILRFNSLVVTDIGGEGEYVAPENRGKNYLGGDSGGYQKNGSFGTLNVRLFAGPARNVLWHPVKPLDEWIKRSYKRFLSKMKWILRHKPFLAGKSVKALFRATGHRKR